jgi:hypothetical protein
MRLILFAQGFDDHARQANCSKARPCFRRLELELTLHPFEGLIDRQCPCLRSRFGRRTDESEKPSSNDLNQAYASPS